MLRKILRKWQSSVPDLLVVCLFNVLAPSLLAQTAGIGALTGRVTDASGGVVTNATVTATNIETGQAHSATAGTDGTYKLDVDPGNYRVKFEAAGFKTVEIPSVTVSGAEMAVLDEKLEAVEPITAKPTPAQQDNLPNAPSSSATAPSLSDLGLSPEQTRGNPQEQALLDTFDSCSSYNLSNRIIILPIRCFSKEIHASACALL